MSPGIKEVLTFAVLAYSTVCACIARLAATRVHVDLIVTCATILAGGALALIDF